MCATAARIQMQYRYLCKKTLIEDRMDAKKSPDKHAIDSPELWVDRYGDLLCRIKWNCPGIYSKKRKSSGRRLNGRPCPLLG